MKLFLHLATQWVYVGTAMKPVRLGLNYQSLELLFKIYNTKNRKEVFEGLQIMELAVLRVDAKSAEKSGGK